MKNTISALTLFSATCVACAQTASISEQDDTYFVIKDVQAYAEGLHGVQAQEQALLSACAQAFAQLMSQISYYNAVKPCLAQKQIKNMLVKYSISNENISEKTYSASFTMYFSQKKVLSLCLEQKIPLKDEFHSNEMEKTVKVRQMHSLSAWPEVARKFNEDGIFYVPYRIVLGRNIEVDVVQTASIQQANRNI